MKQDRPRHLSPPGPRARQRSKHERMKAIGDSDELDGDRHARKLTVDARPLRVSVTGVER
jgi:hypothetical protein